MSEIDWEISDVLDRPRLRKRISAEDAGEFVATISIRPNQVGTATANNRACCGREMASRTAVNFAGSVGFELSKIVSART